LGKNYGTKSGVYGSQIIYETLSELIIRHHRVLAKLIYFSLHKTFDFRMKKESLAFLLRICEMPGSIPYQWPIIREFYIFLWTLELKYGTESEMCAYQFMISSHSAGRHCTA